MNGDAKDYKNKLGAYFDIVQSKFGIGCPM